MTAGRVLPLERPLVLGLGRAGVAVLGALIRRGVTDPALITAVDDCPTDATRDSAESRGAVFMGAPRATELAAVVAGCTALLPSPGIPGSHPAFALAQAHDVPVLGEFDLVDAWDDRPLVVITGTDGKTTVTTMVTEMLAATGMRVVAAGNNDLPLVEAIDDLTIERFVVEASSFGLGHTSAFRPAVGTWLNFASDHLDHHGSLERYEAAKAKLFSSLRIDGVAVANLDDPIVMRNLPAHCEVALFTTGDSRVGFRVENGVLQTNAYQIVRVDELPRALPHDLANSLAAAATALHAGASLDAVRRVLRSFTGLPHRLQLVADVAGVRWYDDSKATTPHATLTAVSGFHSVILIAGGRNKGTDLSVLAEGAPHVRDVVAIGEAAGEVALAFNRVRPVHEAADMEVAVRIAADLAREGDTVLLSPACASYDMFASYAERGDVFASAVRALPIDREVPS